MKPRTLWIITISLILLTSIFPLLFWSINEDLVLMPTIMFLILDVALLLCAIYYSIAAKRGESKDFEGSEKQEIAISFYKVCKQNGISFPVSDDKLSDLKYLAKENKVSVTKCHKIFNLGYSKTIEKQRINEEQDKRTIETRMKYLGTNKYIQGLVEAFQEDYDKYLTFYAKTYSILDRKTNVYARKRDWAIAGGIAEGFGGLGIGLLTALKVQEENEKAELCAQATRRAAYEAISKAEAGNKNLIEAVNKVTNELKKFETILGKSVKTTIAPDHFIVQEYAVRESGTLWINISPKAKNLTGQKRLDGIACVKVICNTDIVGEGYIGSPGYLYGFDEEKYIPYIDAMGLDNFNLATITCFPLKGHKFNPNEKYRFEFTSFNTYEIDVEELKSAYKNLCKIYNDDYLWKKKNLIRNLFVDATCT